MPDTEFRKKSCCKNSNSFLQHTKCSFRTKNRILLSKKELELLFFNLEKGIPAKVFGKRGELPQTIFCGSPVRAVRAESPAENSPGLVGCKSTQPRDGMRKNKSKPCKGGREISPGTNLCGRISLETKGLRGDIAGKR